ncbi:MAG: biotin--[acetyl-CoA-carboxylase] ligase [Erythrobacter sp.]|nr:MAG: biotin--[acetyl-CoA-carboxylase] ligase [Erythrobacter sp.]
MIEVVSETGSTSADLLARLRSGERLAEGDWLVADRQSAGKGRQGRAWIDAPGNFMGSTVVRLYPQDPSPATLSLVAALAVYEAVLPRLANPSALQLKWPNDLMLDRAKLSGILLEREGDYAVIGIGVNLAAAPLVEGRTVGSLASSGPAPARDAFAADLAAQMATEVRRWREFGIGPILNRWRAAAHPPGTLLTLQESDGTSTRGTFDSIGDDGTLHLRLPDGSTRAIHAGDVMLEDG